MKQELTQIYFVRHAESQVGSHDDASRGLTSKGIEDRKLVTAYLKDKAIDAVLSSPYQRAFDTVLHYADEYGREISLIHDFREREIDSVWIEDFKTFSMKQWEDFDYKRSCGESLREVQKRSVKALINVLKKYNGKNLVIGSHGTALSTIIHHYHTAFNYEAFTEIKDIMPLIAHFVFKGERLIQIELVNLFLDKENQLILKIQFN